MSAHRSPTEFEIIAEYFVRDTSDPDVRLGIGDDAALVTADGVLAVSTDTLVGGTHFLSTLAPARLARRALAVNLSDLAAMGATPRWFTLALTLPAAEPDWLAAFAAALHTSAAASGISLIGGNLARGPLSLTLTVIGSVPSGLALLRSGAQVGDDIYVTGHLGDAAAGLGLLRADRAPRSAAETYLIDRFELPTARVSAGVYLRGVASAAIDVSDGLLADLGHICESSACGAGVDVEALPLSSPLRATLGEDDAIVAALTGGDDYELCFTAPASRSAELARADEGAIGTRFHRIGRIVAGNGITCRRNNRPMTLPRGGGYRHF
jgi:thiamine-monophosphate kinase